MFNKTIYRTLFYQNRIGLLCMILGIIIFILFQVDPLVQPSGDINTTTLGILDFFIYFMTVAFAVIQFLMIKSSDTPEWWASLPLRKGSLWFSSFLVSSTMLFITFVAMVLISSLNHLGNGVVMGGLSLIFLSRLFVVILHLAVLYLLGAIVNKPLVILTLCVLYRTTVLMVGGFFTSLVLFTPFKDSYLDKRISHRILLYQEIPFSAKGMTISSWKEYGVNYFMISFGLVLLIGIISVVATKQFGKNDFARTKRISTYVLPPWFLYLCSIVSTTWVISSVFQCYKIYENNYELMYRDSPYRFIQSVQPQIRVGIIMGLWGVVTGSCLAYVILRYLRRKDKKQMELGGDGE